MDEARARDRWIDRRPRIGRAGLAPVLLGLLAFTAPRVARATSDEGLAFDVAPYLWIATAGGDFGVPGSDEQPPVSGGGSPFDSETSIRAGFMLKAEARYGAVGLLLDGAWVKLATEASGRGLLYQDASVDTDLGFGTLAVTYALPVQSGFSFRPFVGARVFFADIQLHFDGRLLADADASGSDAWVDPVIGALARYSFTDDFYASLVGDVGGFDVSSRITWELYGGLGYDLADWFTASLGYRYLVDDYENDAFVLDVSVQGFLVGASFRF